MHKLASNAQCACVASQTPGAPATPTPKSVGQQPTGHKPKGRPVAARPATQAPGPAIRRPTRFTVCIPGNSVLPKVQFTDTPSLCLRSFPPASQASQLILGITALKSPLFTQAIPFTTPRHVESRRRVSLAPGSLLAFLSLPSAAGSRPMTRQLHPASSTLSLTLTYSSASWSVQSPANTKDFLARSLSSIVNPSTTILLINTSALPCSCRHC